MAGFFLNFIFMVALPLIASTVEIYPHLVYAPNSPHDSTSVNKAAFSTKTMRLFLNTLLRLLERFWLPGTPSFVFWTFKSKVRPNDTGY